MARTIFCSRITPQRYWITWRHQDKVIREIEHICRVKKQKAIEPARATWRELREVLDEVEQIEYLPNLVALNVITKQRILSGESYAVNWQRVNQLWEERKDKNKWP